MDFRARILELAARAGLTGVRRTVAIAVVTLLAVVVAWTLLRNGGGHGEDIPYADEGAAPPAASLEMTPAGATDPMPTTLWVHVVGAVRNPSVYELDSGARVGDAVQAAGGLLGNAAQEGVNLARVVSDGEQVCVPTRDEWEAGRATGGGSAVSEGTPSSSSGGGVSGQVNLNTADAAALDALPGVGPATAARIVQDRDENGPFASVDDLARVSGIGPAKLEALRDLACVK